MSFNGGFRTRLDEVWGVGPILGVDGQPIQRRGETLRQMQARADHLVRNNVLAAGVLDRACENTIGTGISLRSTCESKVFRDKVNDEWRRRSEGKFLDVRRTFTFDQMQDLVYRSGHTHGDAALLLIDRGKGPELQVLSGRLLETPPGRTDRNVVDGVEVDDIGAPVAYWFRVSDGNTTGTGVGGIGPQRTTHKRVVARDVIFHARSQDYDAVRGTPTFNGTYTLFEQVLGYIDAVVVASRVGASQAMILKRKGGATGLKGRDSSVHVIGQVLSAAGLPTPGIVIEPGMINVIDADDDLTGFNPTQPTQAFSDVLRTLSRFLGLKFGLTLERVMLDFSKANYSVSRSTALQEQRTSEVEQWDFNGDVFARLWPWFVSKLVKSNVISVGPVPDDAWAYEWTPNGRPLQEPSNDAPGIKTLMELGLESPITYLRARGYDPKVVVDEIAEFRQLRVAAGLPPDAIPTPIATAATSAFGTIPIEAPADDEDDDEDED